MAIYFHENDVKVNVLKRRMARQCLLKVVSKLGYKDAEVNYVFCSDQSLLKINVEYLNHDTYTDVITFDYTRKETSCGDEITELQNMLAQELQSEFGLAGDVYISYDRVRENAKMFHVKQIDELNRVLVHGLLHLAGYKDKTPEEEKIMRRMEDEMLSSCFAQEKKEEKQ